MKRTTCAGEGVQEGHTGGHVGTGGTLAQVYHVLALLPRVARDTGTLESIDQVKASGSVLTLR